MASNLLNQYLSTLKMYNVMQNSARANIYIAQIFLSFLWGAARPDFPGRWQPPDAIFSRQAASRGKKQVECLENQRVPGKTAQNREKTGPRLDFGAGFVLQAGPDGAGH
jgi:hypothetical protein